MKNNKMSIQNTKAEETIVKIGDIIINSGYTDTHIKLKYQRMPPLTQAQKNAILDREQEIKDMLVDVDEQ